MISKRACSHFSSIGTHACFKPCLILRALDLVLQLWINNEESFDRNRNFAQNHDSDDEGFFFDLIGLNDEPFLSIDFDIINAKANFELSNPFHAHIPKSHAWCFLEFLHSSENYFMSISSSTSLDGSILNHITCTFSRVATSHFPATTFLTWKMKHIGPISSFSCVRLYSF